jgi:hypothetical protein
MPQLVPENVPQELSDDLLDPPRIIADEVQGRC